MSTRILLPVAAIVVAVGLLAAGALHFLSQDGPGDPPPRDDGPAKPANRAPEVTPQSSAERVQIRHDLPWPFAEFEDDIRELRRPVRREVFFERDRIERELGERLNKHKFSVELENVTVDDVVRDLAVRFAPLGIKVYTLPPPVENDPFFEKLSFVDTDVWAVIEEMRVRTNDLVTFAVTPEGLCVGSKKACINARAAAEQWEEEQVGEGTPDEAFDFLKGDYRPDFQDAHIGLVVRDVREQTGVEVVVGPEVWSLPVKVTWRADPMPVLAALRQIAIKVGGALYAKDDRVFLLDR